MTLNATTKTAQVVDFKQITLMTLFNDYAILFNKSKRFAAF